MRRLVCLVCVIVFLCLLRLGFHVGQELGHTTKAFVDRSNLDATSRPDGLCFLTIGDWGKPLPETHEVALQMGLYAAKCDAKFVISTGDNFYMRGVSGADDPLFQSNFEDVFTHSALHRTRWFISLGNHDQTRGTIGQIQYTNRSARWFLPNHWYSHVVPIDESTSLEIFVLDHYHNIQGRYTVFTEQLPWLQRQLSRSKAQWKIVVDHRPVYSGGGYHGPSPKLQTALVPLLKAHSVQLVVSGDDHILEILRVSGITYVVSGAGSWLHPDYRPTPYTLFGAMTNGFTAHHLNRTHMAIHLIAKNGSVLYSTTISQ